MALSLLNDLKAAAFDALLKKRKGPALLLLYSFIDICASLANADPHTKLPDRFKSYLKTHALCRWSLFSPDDLWAARCSLLHAYSPFGDHTKKRNGAKPIFYYAWPEKPDTLEMLLQSRGQKNFVIVDVKQIKSIALSAFNSLFRELEEDPTLEATVASNAKQLLRMIHDIHIEQFMEWTGDEKTLLD